jgi:hypothetical protein
LLQKEETMRVSPIPALAAALLLACQDAPEPAAPNASPALAADPSSAATLTAEVEFGSEDVGSPFPPGEHDRSFHAFDKLRPRTVVIQRGGSVTYLVDECHQPAVYAPGTEPGDIDVTLTEPIGVAACPPDRINDPNGRLALAPPQTDVETVWTTPAGTFDQPGTYLVICTTFVHFFFAQMYGWVIVK